MEATTSNLVNQCRNIEFRIENERQRLQTTKEMLERYKTNQEISSEQENNKKREEDIEQYRNKVNVLKTEFGILRNAIAEIERERAEVSGPNIEKKKRSLNVMAAEIDAWDCEISKIEKQIQKIKDVNTWMEQENRRKLEEHQANNNPLTEKKSSGNFQLGRLRMKEIEVKLILASDKENLKRVLDGTNALQNNLKEVESQCRHQENNIEMKEYQYLSLMDTVIKKKGRDCSLLESQIENFKINLNNLRKSFEERKPMPDFNEVIERNAIGKEQIEKAKMRIEELRLEFGILFGTLVKIKRDKVEFFESLTKKRDTAMRKINSDIYQTKEEIASIDDKIKNVKKVTKWTKDNYDKTVREHSVIPPFDQRELTRFRVVEEETRKTVDNLKENSKKLQEQIAYLRVTLKDVESQFSAEEQKAEDISTGVKELKKAEEMAINEEIRMRNTGSLS